MMFTNVIYKKKYLLATQELEEVKKDNVALRAILKHWKAIENRTCDGCKGYVDFDYCKIIDDDCRLIVTLCNGCNRYEPKEIK